MAHDIAALAAEHMRWQGRTLLPRTGCRALHMPLGNASVWTEYELLDDRAVVLQVLVNGQLIDAECFIHPLVVEAWEELLWQSHVAEKACGVAA